MKIIVPHGNRFREAGTELAFRPLGCNYFDPATGWAPQVWKRFDPLRTERHLRQMKELGVNTIRVFLTTESFMTADGGLLQAGMDQAKRMLELAGENGIRIQWEGPCGWEGNPEWADELSDGDDNAYFLAPGWLERLERFWESFAGEFHDDARVFGYDLLNEPWLHYDSPLLRKIWGGTPPLETTNVGGEPLTMMTTSFDYSRPAEGFADWQAYQELRERVTGEWTSRLTQAIRRADRNHPVTIGFHQLSLPEEADAIFNPTGFSAKRLAPMLDYVAFHWYPYLDHLVKPHDDPAALLPNIERIRASIRNLQTDKPVTLEEFGWYGGAAVDSWGKRLPFVTEEMQAEWCRMLIEGTRELASGWLCWGFSDVPVSSDISKKSGLVDENGRVKKWGEAFAQLSRG